MDQELKQRMIGAAVIIALAVIFVPMIFDGDIEEKHNKNISINIPDEPDSNLEVKKFSIDKPVSESVELPAGEVELTVNKDEPVLLPVEEKPKDIVQNIEIEPIEKDDLLSEINQPDENTPTEEKPKSIETTEEKPVVNVPVETASNNSSSQQSPLTQAFRVKLGSFSQKANAEKVKSSLLQNSIKTMVEYNSTLKLYRVWSEQIYQSETSAKNYVDTVKKLNLKIGEPKVITLTANEIESMAAQGQLGWVVQMGSFSEKNNAIELRNKMAAAGFRGFVDQVKTSSGKTLYRLRIGPLMEKSDAEKTKTEIKAKLKLDGLVKSHDLSQIVN